MLFGVQPGITRRSGFCSSRLSISWGFQKFTTCGHVRAGPFTARTPSKIRRVPELEKFSEALSANEVLKGEKEAWEVAQVSHKLSPERLQDELRQASVAGTVEQENGGLWVQIFKHRVRYGTIQQIRSPH